MIKYSLMHPRLFQAFVSIFFFIFSAYSLSEPGENGTERIIHAAEEPGNWLSYGRDYKEQRHSPLKKINDKNVGKLGLDWYYDLQGSRGLEATPLFVDGVLYFTGNWSVVYALDARTGEELWVYDPKVPKRWGQFLCCDAVNRGVAFYEGKILVGTLDGRLLAIDANTGEKIWETLTIDQSLPYSITGAPRAAKGKVFIGNGGGEFGVRGYISAYDVNTGEMIWRFYTVPGNPADGFENEAMEKAAKTWNGEWWKYGGGGTVWDSIVYDYELDQLIFGVGNGGPYTQDIRSPGGGDNLFLSSLVSVNPDTGEYLWHYQEVPGDEWDYTANQTIILTDMEIDGKTEKVLWHAPKNGFFFIINRKNGKLISAEPFASVTWTKGFDLKTGRPIIDHEAVDYSDEPKLIKPSAVGAHNWHPMAYNPDTGLVYIPAMEIGAMMARVDLETFKFNKGRINVGSTGEYPPDDPQLAEIMMKYASIGRLIAWDPKTQSERWGRDHSMVWNGGILSTAGNLVFQGTSDRRFLAMRADNGELLWEAPSQSSIIAAPITYELDGEQYIAVLAGWGGALPLLGVAKQPLPKPDHGRLLVFKLGSNEQLPPLGEPVAFPEPPARKTTDEAVIKRGQELFNENCSWCHGINAVSSGVIPDLRYLTPEKHMIFTFIVKEGALKTVGMPDFSDVLNDEEIDTIHTYIVEQANRTKELNDQPAWWRNLKAWVYETMANTVGVLVSKL